MTSRSSAIPVVSVASLVYENGVLVYDGDDPATETTYAVEANASEDEDGNITLSATMLLDASKMNGSQRFLFTGHCS